MHRLPILPKSPPPPPPSPPPPPLSEEAQAKKDASSEEVGQEAGQDGKTQGKKELIDQLKGRRKEVERLMAKRRADREGITVEVSVCFVEGVNIWAGGTFGGPSCEMGGSTIRWLQQGCW